MNKDSWGIEDTVSMCEDCINRQACEARQDTDSWIYSDQFALCLDSNRPEYHDVDWWILHETMQGRELTLEEAEQLERELGIIPDAV
jgi:hypothetical protein